MIKRQITNNMYEISANLLSLKNINIKKRKRKKPNKHLIQVGLLLFIIISFFNFLTKLT